MSDHQDASDHRLPAGEWRRLVAAVQTLLERVRLPAGVDPLDLVQESLLRAVRAFSVGQPGLSPQRRLAYVRSIARNAIRDVLRAGVQRERMRLAGTLHEIAELESAGGTVWPGNRCAGAGSRRAEAEAKAALRELLVGQVDALAIELLLLTRWDGFDLARACALLGLTRRQAAAARRRLQRFLSTPGAIGRLLDCLDLEQPQTPRPPMTLPRTHLVAARALLLGCLLGLGMSAGDPAATAGTAANAMRMEPDGDVPVPCKDVVVPDVILATGGSAWALHCFVNGQCFSGSDCYKFTLQQHCRCT